MTFTHGIGVFYPVGILAKVSSTKQKIKKFRDETKNKKNKKGGTSYEYKKN